MPKICPQLSSVDLDGKLVLQECLEHKCAFFVNVIGHNPNTGEQVNQWDCATAWTPVLLIENSQQQRQTGAAVESLKNEMKKDVVVIGHALASAQNNAIEHKQ